MDVQLPEDVSPLQKAVLSITQQAEKLGYNQNWKDFKVQNDLCKFYFDPALADKLMEAGHTEVIKDFIKAEISDNNSFVATNNIKDLINSSDDIKQIYRQETISKSGWDWTNDSENEEAFKQRSAITLGDSNELGGYDSIDEFNDLFGGNENKAKTPTLAELKAESKYDSIDEFNDLFGGNENKAKTPTLAELKAQEQEKAEYKKIFGEDDQNNEVVAQRSRNTNKNNF